MQKPVATKEIAFIAEQFFKASFRKQEGGGKKWPARKFDFPGKQRALLMNRGKLRNSIHGSSNRNRAVVSSHLPYAEIHNEGGTIVITAKMRRFFWAMYYKAMGGALNKKGNASSIAQGKKLMAAALPWKLLALHKGDTLKIPQRQFMYHSNDLNMKIDRYLTKFIKNLQ